MTIWSGLHGLSHLDHSLKSTSNNFVLPDSFDEIWDWHTTSYQESIQMFALLPIIFGIIYFVTSILILCCHGICGLCGCISNTRNPNINNKYSKNSLVSQEGSDIGSNDPNKGLLDYSSPRDNHINSISRKKEIERELYHRQLTPYTMYCRFILALLVIVAIAISVYYGYKLNNTIIDVQNNWDDSYQPYDVCITYGNSLESTINDAITQCEAIKATKTVPTQLNDAVQLIEKQLNSSYNSVNNYISTAKTISWGDSGEIDDYRSTALYAGISVLSFAALLLIVSVCTKTMTITKWIMCNTIISVLLAFGMLIIWIIASVEFAGSVEVSDVCYNPDSAILQAVNKSTNPDNSTMVIVKYYIYCNQQHSNNPLITQTDNAYNQILPLNKSIYNLTKYASQYDIETEVNSLITDYSKALTDLIYLNESLQCETINGYYTDIKQDTCNHMINQWFILYCLQFGIVLLLILRSLFICTKEGCCTCKKNNEIAAQAHKEHIDNIKQKYSNKFSSIDSNPQYAMLPDDVALEDATPPPAKKSIVEPTFSDSEYKRCINYLLQFIDPEVRKEKAESLKEIGYPNNSIEPLHSTLVDKSMAIIRNSERNKDSNYQHPLLPKTKFNV